MLFQNKQNTKLQKKYYQYDKYIESQYLRVLSYIPDTAESYQYLKVFMKVGYQLSIKNTFDIVLKIRRESFIKFQNIL